MQAWTQLLKRLEIELGVETVQRWLHPLKVIRFDACNLYLEAADAFQSLWFEEHIRGKISSQLINNSGKPIKVHITTAEEISASKNKGAKSPHPYRPSSPFTLSFAAIDPYCNLENFVFSPATLLAYKLLCHTAGCNPLNGHPDANATPELGAFNPIYLYGNKGSGKSHLLMAVASALRQRGLSALYVRADTFTQHVVAAIRAGEMSAFRQAYRTIDTLLIDDVQTFSGKAATQEELFHTFNALHVNNRQIILSATCTPAELAHIEARLISRFEWGITLPLPPAEGELLEIILRKKMDALHFPLHPTIVEFLLHTFRNSKNLVQALEALMLRGHLHKRGRTALPSLHITLPQVKHYLDDLISSLPEHALTPEKILAAIGQMFGVKRDDITGKGKSREYVLPRQLAMYLCRKQLKLPFKKIGAFFDKDHSTVMASVKLIQQGIDNNSEPIISAYYGLSRQLQQETYR